MYYNSDLFNSQALFQSGRIKESITHFKQGLHILGMKMPTNILGSTLNLAYHDIRQYFHIKFHHEQRK